MQINNLLWCILFGKSVTLWLTEHTQEFQARQPDRKRENEQKSAGSSDSQSEASSSRADEASAAVDPGSQESSEQPDEPAAKKHKTQESEEPVETESAQSDEYKSPDPAELTLQEDEPLAAEADEPSQAAEQVESIEALDEGIREGPDAAAAAGSDSVSEIKETADTPEELGDAAAETSNKFFCYICNITCHNQQSFQSHMNGLTHQQKMMEIQHMSNACLVTLLPRVQESLQGARRDGEKRPGLQRWCSTCQTHFTTNVMEHRRTKEHKRCSRSSSSSCTVCKLHFRTPREFVEHMQSPEHKRRVQQLWKASGEAGVDQLNADMFLGEEDGECSDDEREEEENGKEGVAAQMEVTLEDLSEDEEFDSDTVYGGSRFFIRYKALKTHEESGSTSGDAADHMSPDPAPQTLQSCSRQEVETLAQEEAVAREPEDEGKSVGGRGRTPAKRRGRGGRRR
ncbi:uncharacterized protein [Sinocyclocheilus grahami]|uniref:uncharacterized protein n=1 Tax=Sinocyclocheilus grahami TaxID=75366 RepID=UPI0007AD1C13|nr:PREDICTED: uncharacterized protein LOC107576208 [Sinocyclocheilus grahami]